MRISAAQYCLFKTKDYMGIMSVFRGNFACFLLIRVQWNLLYDFRIVGITLCEKGNTISEPQFIAKMQELKNKSKFMHIHDTCN